MPTAMTFQSLQTDMQNYLERGTTLDPIVYQQLPELINLAERRIARELKVMGFIVAASFNMQQGLAVYAKPDRWREMISINVGAPKTPPTNFVLTQAFVLAPGVSTVYYGTFPTGAGNALAGQQFTITGFTNAANNGTYVVIGSAANEITVSNGASVNETNPAIATQVSFANGNFNRQPVLARSYEYLRAYWPDDSQTNLSTYGTAAPPKFYATYNYQNIIVAPTPDLPYPAEMVYYEEPALLDATNNTNWITQYAPNLLLYSALLEATPFLKNDSRIGTWQAMYDRAAAAMNSESNAGVLDRDATRQES